MPLNCNHRKFIGWLTAATIGGLILGGCGAPPRPVQAGDESVRTAAHVAATAAVVNHTAPTTDLFGAQWCGAALIAPTTLLTAAHCVRSRRPGSLDVVVAADNLCNTAPIIGERLQIIAVWIHPDPKVDLAKLTTVRAARTSPVPVAALNHGGEAAKLVAVGWGRNTRSGASPCRKRTVPLAPATEGECEEAERTNPSRWHPGQLCAVAGPGSARNTCTGDSGGPVYRISGAHAELVAVVNWGVGCEPDQPGFYTPASLAVGN